MKVLIIDDEPEIRRLLRKMVERQPDYQVVAECGDFAGAVAEFSRHRPEVVFVDIDLAGQGESDEDGALSAGRRSGCRKSAGPNGLECAKVMVELDPKVKIIFATAHSEYMANAFEIYAFDYLVKPFNLERLTKTLDRIRGNLEPLALPDQVIQPEQNHPTGAGNSFDLSREKLLVKGKEQAYFIHVPDILFVERTEGCTDIVTSDETYRTSASLSELEEKLDPSLFLRSHKSYIVNLSRITRIEPYGRWTYVVKFKDSGATALMTAKNYEEMKRRFS